MLYSLRTYLTFVCCEPIHSRYKLCLGRSLLLFTFMGFPSWYCFPSSKDVSTCLPLPKQSQEIEKLFLPPTLIQAFGSAILAHSPLNSLCCCFPHSVQLLTSRRLSFYNLNPWMELYLSSAPYHRPQQWAFWLSARLISSTRDSLVVAQKWSFKIANSETCLWVHNALLLTSWAVKLLWNLLLGPVGTLGF